LFDLNHQNVRFDTKKKKIEQLYSYNYSNLWY